MFNLGDDPAELANRSEDEPERVQAMKDLIDAWNEQVERSESGEDAELNKEDLEALESLGYLE